jgi:hypothetical protein
MEFSRWLKTGPTSGVPLPPRRAKFLSDSIEPRGRDMTGFLLVILYFAMAALAA